MGVGQSFAEEQAGVGINGAAGGEEADGDPVGSVLHQQFGVEQHGLNFGVRVAEVTFAGSDHGDDFPAVGFAGLQEEGE